MDSEPVSPRADSLAARVPAQLAGGERETICVSHSAGPKGIPATKVRSCKGIDASAIHPRCMNEFTKDDLREIEQIHSNWIKYEVAADNHSLIALCADDIELWPPDARPLLGRAAVSAQITREKATIRSIEITDRRIRGSNEIAYLTANYRTTFSSAEDSTYRQALGSHLWMMQKRAGTWVVTLVSWSVWGSADTSATSQPPLFPSTGVTP